MCIKWRTLVLTVKALMSIGLQFTGIKVQSLMHEHCSWRLLPPSAQKPSCRLSELLPNCLMGYIWSAKNLLEQVQVSLEVLI